MIIYDLLYIFTARACLLLKAVTNSAVFCRHCPIHENPTVCPENEMHSENMVYALSAFTPRARRPEVCV